MHNGSDQFNYNEYVFYKYAGAVAVSDRNEKEGINKLGKPIHVYTDKHRTKEVLTILPPKGSKEYLYVIGDTNFLFRLFLKPLSLEYRITDATTGEFIGSVVQEGLKTTRDEWSLISENGIVGRLVSCKYFLHSLIWPRTYRIVQNRWEIGTLKQHRSMLSFKYTMRITERCIDNRLLVSAGVIIASLKPTF